MFFGLAGKTHDFPQQSTPALLQTNLCSTLPSLMHFATTNSNESTFKWNFGQKKIISNIFTYAKKWQNPNSPESKLSFKKHLLLIKQSLPCISFCLVEVLVTTDSLAAKTSWLDPPPFVMEMDLSLIQVCHRPWEIFKALFGNGSKKPQICLITKVCGKRDKKPWLLDGYNML